MIIPKAGVGEFVLINIEGSTGKILCSIISEKNYYAIHGKDYYTIVEGIEKAVDEAKLRVANNDKIEVVIFNKHGDYLDTIYAIGRRPHNINKPL